MIYNILEEIEFKMELVKRRGETPIGAFIHPMHRTEILNRYYPHTDWSAVKGGLTDNTVIYVLGLIVCFDVNVGIDDVLIAYNPTV